MGAGDGAGEIGGVALAACSVGKLSVGPGSVGAVAIGAGAVAEGDAGLVAGAELCGAWLVRGALVACNCAAVETGDGDGDGDGEFDPRYEHPVTTIANKAAT